MKMTINELAKKFRTMVGDMSEDIPDEFFLAAVNWAFTDLPLVPKLGKIFSKHYQASNLDAKGHFRWKLNRDFRRITDVPMLNFFTSTGGEPCPLKVCHLDVEEFYKRNGIISLKRAGKPCTYTLEQEGDDLFLVLDRPSDVPIIIDYIAYGFPKPVTKMSDTREISAIAEPLILSVMQTVYFKETSDFAWSGAITDYISNALIPEAIQALYSKYGSDGPQVLGEII